VEKFFVVLVSILFHCIVRVSCAADGPEDTLGQKFYQKIKSLLNVEDASDERLVFEFPGTNMMREDFDPTYGGRPSALAFSNFAAKFGNLYKLDGRQPQSTDMNIIKLAEAVFEAELHEEDAMAKVYECIAETKRNQPLEESKKIMRDVYAECSKTVMTSYAEWIRYKINDGALCAVDQMFNPMEHDPATALAEVDRITKAKQFIQEKAKTEKEEGGLSGFFGIGKTGSDNNQNMERMWSRKSQKKELERRVQSAIGDTEDLWFVVDFCQSQGTCREHFKYETYQVQLVECEEKIWQHRALHETGTACKDRHIARALAEKRKLKLQFAPAKILRDPDLRIMPSQIMRPSVEPVHWYKALDMAGDPGLWFQDKFEEETIHEDSSDKKSSTSASISARYAVASVSASVAKVKNVAESKKEHEKHTLEFEYNPVTVTWPGFPMWMINHGDQWRDGNYPTGQLSSGEWDAAGRAYVTKVLLCRNVKITSMAMSEASKEQFDSLETSLNVGVSVNLGVSHGSIELTASFDKNTKTMSLTKLSPIVCGLVVKKLGKWPRVGNETQKKTNDEKREEKALRALQGRLNARDLTAEL